MHNSDVCQKSKVVVIDVMGAQRQNFCMTPIKVMIQDMTIFPNVAPIWMLPKIGDFSPKWMVKIMENPIKMDSLGVPFFFETSI